MSRAFTIIDACDDPDLFARWFKDRATWQAWFAFLAALFALPLSDEQRAIFAECTGRGAPPAAPVTEAWLVCGRRAGKSFILALIAVFLACFNDWSPFLGPGERGTIMVIASRPPPGPRRLSLRPCSTDPGAPSCATGRARGPRCL